MRRMQWSLIIGAAVLLSLGLLILAGCSGGGGPLTQPLVSTGPSPSAQFIALLPAVQRTATPVGTAKCAECHKDTHKDPDFTAFAQTVHAANNVGCESCHGPGSTHASAPSKANILTGPSVTRPTVCGQCHGPIHDQFQQSRHASVIEDVLLSAQSSPAAAKTCFRCHSAAFRAFMIDEPLSHVAKAGIPVDQTIRDQIDANINALTTNDIAPFTVQGATVESASCGTCHDPHRNTGNLNSEGKEQYLRRATFRADSVVTTDLVSNDSSGATVPVKNYTTIDHMCGTCHNGRGVNPTDKALANPSRPGFHNGPQFNMLLGVGGSETITSNGAAINLPPVARTSSHSLAPNQCVHCHLPSQRHTFTVSLDTSCAPCHTAADAAAREDSLKSEILNGLTGLRTRLENWAIDNVKDSSGRLLSDQSLWDYPANIPLVDANGAPLIDKYGNPVAAPNQKTIPIEFKRARHNYYFLANDRSFGVHNAVYARYLLQTAKQNLDSISARSVQERSIQSTRTMLELVKRDLRRGARGAMSELR